MINVGGGRVIYCKRYQIRDWFGDFDMGIKVWITFGRGGFLVGKGWWKWSGDKLRDKWIS